MKTKGRLLKGESFCGPLEGARLGRGSEWWCETKVHHRGRGLDAIRSGPAVQKQMGGHTFGGRGLEGRRRRW